MSEPIVGHYEGFRLFEVAGERLHSIAADFVYEPGVNQAVCGQKRKHEPPEKGCMCGFWLYHRQARAWAQFEADLTPPKKSAPGNRISSVYGDFGFEDEEEPIAVLGKVRGGGKAIMGDDGARVAQVEIVALVTDEPGAFTAVLDHYRIEASPPTPTTRAWIVDITDNTVMLETPTPTPAEDQEIGLFIVDEGVELPALGSHVFIEFERRGAMRCITYVGRVPKDMI